MRRFFGLLAMGLVATMMLGGCGPDIGESSSEALAEAIDGGAPSESSADDSLVDLSERDSLGDTSRRCGWLCCSMQHTACGRRNASIDSDYIMEPCDLFYEMCVDGLPD